MKILAKSSETSSIRKKTRGGSFLSNAAYRFALILLGGITLFLVLLLKSETASDALTDPILLFYTIFVTSFQLSRVISAMLWKPTDYKTLIYDRSFEPNVSIVIPCMNEEKSIAKTIVQSFAADYPREKLEVIAINDGSTDGTLGVLLGLQEKYRTLKIINFERNRGKRHGMAAGFKMASGEIVVQLDSDSYFDPKTFRGIIEPFIDPKVGAVCAHADPENADQNLLTKMQAAYYYMSFRILKAAESTFAAVFCCSGCSSAYRKSIVLPIMDQWLNEKFLDLPVTWGDDRALTNWVLKLDYKTIYTDRARAYTICPDNLRQLLKQQVRWKKGWLVNSIFASKFIWKRQFFVSLTYFFPLIAVTILTPFMALKALVYNPVVNGMSPLYYAAGVFLVTSIIAIYYRYTARENKYWPYLFAWSALNMFVLSFVLFYAVVSIQNRKWGTR